MGWLSIVVFLIIFLLLVVESWILAGLFAIGFFGLGIYLVTLERRKLVGYAAIDPEKIEAAGLKLSNFEITQQHISPTGDKGIIFDERREEIYILWSQLTKHRLYKYTDILSSEIIQDGQLLRKAKRETKTGSAVARNALAEGMQTVLGKKKEQPNTENEMTSLDLKIIVNDPGNPIHMINFLKSNAVDLNGNLIKINMDTKEYTLAAREINQWHQLFSEWIEAADEEYIEKKNAAYLEPDSF